MKGTNVFLSDEECEDAKKLYMMTKEPIFGTTRTMVENTIARVNEAVEKFYKSLDEMAISHGLPNPPVDPDGDVVHYGLNFKTKEILEVD